MIGGRSNDSKPRERERESEIKSASFLLSLAKNHIYSSYTSYFNTFRLVAISFFLSLAHIFTHVKKKQHEPHVRARWYILAHCTYMRNCRGENDALYYHIYMHVCMVLIIADPSYIEIYRDAKADRERERSFWFKRYWNGLPMNERVQWWVYTQTHHISIQYHPIAHWISIDSLITLTSIGYELATNSIMPKTNTNQ